MSKKKTTTTPKKGHPQPPDQRERSLILTELDRNLLVEAAAGTGKTTCMVGRMLALLRTGRCGKIYHLAAVTFTRKAAAELRSRFQVGMEKSLLEADGAERENLQQALAHIEQCFIGTIHSFCARLLRERPVEAGVDLAFEEIDEETDSRLRKEAWDEFAQRLSALDPEGALAGLDRLGLRLADLEAGFLKFADFPDVDDWPLPSGTAELPNLKPAVSEVGKYATHMRKLAHRLPDEWGNDTLIPELRRLPRILSHYEDLSSPARLMGVLELFNKKRGVVQKQWMKDGAFSRQEARDEEVRWNGFREEVAEPLLKRWYEFRYGPVLRIFRQARDAYDRLREERGFLNYQDLLIKAAGLLRDKPHVREYFRDRFRFLLVDEFQDTDPVQAEVMLLLTATDPDECEWRKCRPRPGSLFVVGDPKQSIYRFRRADIVTYNEVKEIIGRGEGRGREGLIVHLSANFRTHPTIIGWVNDVFEPQDGEPGSTPQAADGHDAEEVEGPLLRFPKIEADVSPSYVHLQSGRHEGNAGEITGVFCLRVPAESSKKEDAIEYVADRIARTIRHALDTGLTVSRTLQQIEERRERGGGEGKAERLDPSDFMIVTWKRGPLSALARKLQEYGIPHQVTGGSALNEVSELRLLHACLKAVVRPDDPVALLAALRSELFGLSDADLYAFKKAGGRFSYQSPVPEGLRQTGSEEGFEAFRDTFSRLKEYSGWLTRLPPLSAVEKVVADLGLLALAASRPGGDVEAGSLAKAIEILRSLEHEMWTNVELVEYLGQLVERTERHDGISALSRERPAVRIMNLHKVKGLEAPVVFLADPSGEWDHPVDLHIDRSGEKVLGFLAVQGEQKGNRTAPLFALPEGWENMAEKEKRFRDAEMLRLRYVAATRAGSAMIITQRTGRGNPNRFNPWKHFADFLPADAEIPDPGPQQPPAGHGVPVSYEEVVRAEEEIAARLASVATRTCEVWGVKEYALSMAAGAEAGMPPPPASRMPLSPYPAQDAGLEPESPPAAAGQALETGGPFTGGEHGMEWGTAIHLLLDVAMKRPGADFAPLAEAVLAEQGLDRALAQTAVEEVKTVMSSGIWQRAVKSRQRFTEIPLQMLLEEGVSVPTLLRGGIDLVFREDGGWVIVDYKTDLFRGRSPDGFVQKHAPQVLLYARAWERCTGEKVKEAALYFLTEDLYVPVPYRG